MPGCQGAAQDSSHRRVTAGSDAPCCHEKCSSIPPGSLSAPGHRSLHVFSVHGRHFLLLFKSLSQQSLSPTQYLRISPFSTVICSSPHYEKVWVGLPCPLESHCLLILSAQERWNPPPGPKARRLQGKGLLWSYPCQPCCLQHRSKRHHCILKKLSGLYLYIHPQGLSFLYCIYRSPGLEILV